MYLYILNKKTHIFYFFFTNISVVLHNLQQCVTIEGYVKQPKYL